ncbi:hypothetical protein G5S_0982 [Chlamydia pecorum E58]|uniref:Uncharacterized protein n=1 Tax=Chlamydia pecorum (strain ATCC VR-628 / DSM 29919 / E58) TaxID=331635 RepID=A0AA34WI98_CHLPE|nr:hypothetical protein G5S_0982 [Chlamydia pecorum E58]
MDALGCEKILNNFAAYSYSIFETMRIPFQGIS